MTLTEILSCADRPDGYRLIIYIFRQINHPINEKNFG